MLKNYLPESFKNFIRMESSGALMLFLATMLALAWSNSPFAGTYFELLEEKLTLGFGEWELSETLLHWINDGLMAIFFFMVGLEIKREMLVGELSDTRKAMLPIFAALGGMVIPVLFFFLFNQGGLGQAGWGIPMATDIAFSLGVLQLLGKRVPYGLTAFLLAYAIIDDLGAVLIIAVFYSGSVEWELVIYALLLVAGLFLLNRFAYSRYINLFVGLLVWYFFLEAHIHPTIAGVLMALAIPIRRFASIQESHMELVEANAALIADFQPGQTLLSNQQMGAVDQINETVMGIQPPLQRLEDNLHGWSSFVIIPLFALANAGVSLSGGVALISPLALQISGSMLLGKVLGISLFSLLAIRLNLADLPERVNFKNIIGLGFLGGLGFTMALFISGLAYGEDGQLIDKAKIGILMGSTLAGLIGYFTLKATLGAPQEE